MESWLLFAVLAALCWGSYIIFSKIATSQAYFGMQPAAVSLLIVIGGVLVSL